MFNDHDMSQALINTYLKTYTPKLYSSISQFTAVELAGKDLDQFIGLKSSDEVPKTKANFFDIGLSDLIYTSNEETEVSEKRDLYIYARFDES